MLLLVYYIKKNNERVIVLNKYGLYITIYDDDIDIDNEKPYSIYDKCTYYMKEERNIDDNFISECYDIYKKKLDLQDDINDFILSNKEIFGDMIDEFAAIRHDLKSIPILKSLDLLYRKYYDSYDIDGKIANEKYFKALLLNNIEDDETCNLYIILELFMDASKDCFYKQDCYYQIAKIRYKFKDIKLFVDNMLLSIENDYGNKLRVHNIYKEFENIMHEGHVFRLMRLLYVHQQRYILEDLHTKIDDATCKEIKEYLRICGVII